MAAASTSELSAAPAGSLEPRRTFPSLRVTNGMFLVQPIRPTKKESREMTLREAQRVIRMKFIKRKSVSTTASSVNMGLNYRV